MATSYLDLAWVSRSALLGMLALASCSATDSHVTNQADASSPAIARRDDESASAALALRLSGADAHLRQLLVPNDDGFKRDGDGIDSPGRRVVGRHVFHQLGARLPQNAAEAALVSLGQAKRYQLRISLDDARPVAASLGNGRVVYPDAYASTDAIFATSTTRIEELLLLHDQAAPREFSWTVALPSHLAAPHRELSGALVFSDLNGSGILRVPPPFAVDALGQRREASLEWKTILETQGRLVVRIDTDGLAYPILLDPAVESVFWVQRFPKVKPPPRSLTAMAYDSSRKRTVLFGGSSPNAGQFANDETWEWDGQIWDQVGTIDPPVARDAHAMSFDSDRKVTVLYGGHDGSKTLNDTWEWDGSSWKPRKTTTKPGSGIVPMMAYDSDRMVTVNFTTVFDDAGGSSATYEWDGTDWKLRVTGKQLDTGGMAYDVAHKKTIIFGGRRGGSPSAETLEFDGSTWKARPVGSPSGRWGLGMVYDPFWEKVILFGGITLSSSPFGDTWAWDDTTWKQVASTGPTPRSDMGMTFDSDRLRVVLFGGRTAIGDSDETWEGHLHGNGCKDPSQCETGNCVDGVCCEAQCGSCEACDLASNPGICMPVVGTDDPDSCSGTKTCDASGACKNKQGQPCGSEGCLSGLFCVDAVCCDSACSLTCQACSAATKQSGVDGVCGYAKVGTDLRGDCPDDGKASCGRDGTCDGAGACRKYALGTPCGPNLCSGSTLSGQQCNGAGACSTGQTSQCDPYLCSGSTCGSSCTNDNACIGTAFCQDQTACQPKKDVAADCKGGNECKSGFCVEGICCDSACNGTCQACKASNKVSGADGACGNAKEGTDPHSNCADDGAAGCQHDGTCDGAGACRLYPFGVACGLTACVNNVQTGYACNGTGTCLTDLTVDCKLYLCSGNACATKCTDSTQCAPTAYCDATDQTCKPKTADGTECKTRETCKSTFCVDGLCCNQACTGQCEACDIETAKGSCSPVVGAPHAGHGACEGAKAGEPCSARACDGAKNTASCVGYVGAEIACRSQGCANGTETFSATCDGTGTCGMLKTKTCLPYVCQGDKCGQAPCATNADCVADYQCDTATHECVAIKDATCSKDDNHTLVAPDGRKTDCTPYVCEATRCKDTCISVQDCIAPAACDLTGHCVVPPPGEATEQSGCGCRLAGETDSHRGWSLAGLALSFAMARRRRRERRASVSCA